MLVDPHRDRLLDEALQGLLSMAPDRIESAEHSLREWSRGGGLNAAARADRQILSTFRRIHAAAAQAAQLCRGCVPQQGYGSASPIEQGPVRSSLSVTG